MFFPPYFFDIMVHLFVHLVREVRLCGLVYLRWMYPIKRYMKILKGYVKNHYRPEASMIESDLVGDSNVEGFATSSSVFRKNAPSTPQELQANLRNTTNGASSDRLHFDAQVSLCKTTKELQN